MNRVPIKKLLFILIIFALLFIILPKTASAAIRCWDGGGADNNWSTAGNWSGNAAPGSGDQAVFDNTFAAVVCAGATDSSPNNNATIDASHGGTVQTLRILNYTGTITQSRSLTINTATGFVQSASGSTFTGGSDAIDISVTGGDFSQSAGTFTATSGTMTAADNFTHSAGTFTHNSGTVTLTADDGAGTITGSTTFNNLTLQTACDQDFSVPSGTTLTVSGTLTLNGNNVCGGSRITGAGGISAQGNITATNWGIGGTLVVTIDGTGSQTLSGDSDGAYLPAVNINKSSGTLSFSNTINVEDNWTYTTGTLSVGTSTVAFTANADGAGTITGSHTLNNVNMTVACDQDVTIASGTTLTVSGTLTIGQDTGCVSNSIDGPGTITAQGNLTSNANGSVGNVAITLSGAANQTINTPSGSNFPTGTFTVAKTGGTATLATNFSINATGQDLVLTSGVLNISSFNLTLNDTMTITGQLNQTTGSLSMGATTVNAAGIWMNQSTGDITLSGNVSNSGYIRLDGSGTGCPESDAISISSSAAGTQRTWSGSGTFILIDLTVQDQGGSQTAYSSTNVSGNAWTFNSSCPAYSNRIKTSIQGGATIRSN